MLRRVSSRAHVKCSSLLFTHPHLGKFGFGTRCDDVRSSPRRGIATAAQRSKTRRTNHERFVCDTCSASLSISSRSRHVCYREHRGLPVFECPWCEFKFGHPRDLKNHLRRFGERVHNAPAPRELQMSPAEIIPSNRSPFLRPVPVFMQAAFHTTTLDSKTKIADSSRIEAHKTPLHGSSVYDGDALRNEDAPSVAYVCASADPPPLVTRFPKSAKPGEEAASCSIPLSAILGPANVHRNQLPNVYRASQEISRFGRLRASNVHVNLLVVRSDDYEANAFAERHNLDRLDLDDNSILFRRNAGAEQGGGDAHSSTPHLSTSKNTTSSDHEKARRAETARRCSTIGGGGLPPSLTLDRPARGADVGPSSPKASGSGDREVEWCIATRFRTSYDVSYAERPLRVMLAVAGGISLSDCGSELRWTKTYAWQSNQSDDIGYGACPHCERKVRLDNFKRHLLTHQADRRRPFACTKCEYSTDQAYLLAAHEKTHDKEAIKAHACPHEDCSYRTQLKKNLAEHLRTHDVRVLTYKCTQCAFATDVKGTLTRHERVHDAARPRPHKCPRCEYATDVKRNLADHLRTHEEHRERPFRCGACDYATDIKSNLTKHERGHQRTRGRALECAVCEYVTDRRSDLVRHMRVHNVEHGVRPHKVQKSGYAMEQSSNLRMHM